MQYSWRAHAIQNGESMFPSNEAHGPGGVARAADDSARSDPMLEALVGRSREQSRTRKAGADAVNLVNLVDSAVVNSSPTAMYVDAPTNAKLKKSRGHRRIDWVNAIIAGVAVVVVAGTAVFTGVQVANADPAADAVEILASDEASLAGAEKSLATSTTRLERSIATGLSESALIRTALGELAATETADPVALTGAVQAVDAYRAALDVAVVPAMPAPYVRGRIDEDSLASVADAIDTVQESSMALDDASLELRTARAAVDALNAAYTGQLATFAESLTAYATAENDTHPVADQESRDALTAEAEAVAATPLNGAAGGTVLNAFRAAVLALRADDLRVREIEERERERSRNIQQPVTPAPSPDPEETDPGTTDSETTDPGTTAPGTVAGTTGPADGGGIVEG